MDAFMDFGSIAAVAVIVMHLEEFIDRLWDLEGWAARIRTWAEGIALAGVGYVFGIGIFAQSAIQGYVTDALPFIQNLPPLAIAGFFGLICGVIANLGFDKLKYVKQFMEFTKVRVPVEKRKED